jgi:hypothetical protein
LCGTLSSALADLNTYNFQANDRGEDMNTMLVRVLAGVCLAGALGLSTTPASAQSDTVKEKPRIYTYVSNWVLPRAKWADMEKNNAASQKVIDAAIANGTIFAAGNGEALIHTEHGATHWGWWCATSEAGVLNVLDEFYKNGNATNATFASATAHWDELFVSRFYNYKSGPLKNGYDHASYYKLKADAPNDAVAMLSKALFVPFFDKLMDEGAVTAYQIAEESIHTQDPNGFFIFYLTPDAAGLDKVNAALRAQFAKDPLGGPAFSSMVDYTPHRDDLARSSAIFK